MRKRVEAWDCTVYLVWLETHLELAKKAAKFWDQLDEQVQPAISDLFSTPMTITTPAPLQPATSASAPAATRPTQAPPQSRVATSPFASDDWASRGFR